MSKDLMESTAIVTHNSSPPSISSSPPVLNGLKIQSREDVEWIAKLAVRSGFFKNYSDESKAIMVMLYGLENGMSVIDALNSLYVVNGQFSMYANAISDKLHRCPGVEIKTYVLNEEECVAGLLYKGREEGKAHYSVEMAKRAGHYDRNPNWKSDPESMLYARVVSRLYKRYGKKFLHYNVDVVEDMDDVVHVQDTLMPEEAKPVRKKKKEVERVTKEMMKALFDSALASQDMKPSDVWDFIFWKFPSFPDMPKHVLAEEFRPDLYWEVIELVNSPRWFVTGMAFDQMPKLQEIIKYAE